MKRNIGALSGRDVAMTSRNIVTRIEKLEAGQRVPLTRSCWSGESGTKLRTAVLAANKHGLFGSSDLVLCAAWYGAGKPPAARWHRRFPADLSDIELDYCHRTLRKMVGDGEPKARAHGPDYSLIHVPTNRLWHMALGVET